MLVGAIEEEKKRRRAEPVRWSILGLDTRRVGWSAVAVSFVFTKKRLILLLLIRLKAYDDRVIPIRVIEKE